MLDGTVRSLNSRQQHILLILLQSMSPVTLKVLSELVQVSVRTVQRELMGMDEALALHNLTLDKKTGVGLFIEGPKEAREELQKQLAISKSSIQILSQEDRQFLLGQMLLSLQEPTKLYYFSQKLAVAEATISNDLLKMEPWFQERSIQITRKPGFGIEVIGTESNIRRGIIDLIYEHFSEEQLMNMLSSYKFLLTSDINREMLAADHLLHILDPMILSAIEKALQQAQLAKTMTDSMYVSFILYTALSIQRMKQGAQISLQSSIVEEMKLAPEYEYARRLSLMLTILLKTRISEVETVYMTMHLLGVKQAVGLQQEDFIYEYVNPLIRIVEKELKLDLQDDEQLQQHLATHLKAGLSRMKLGMNLRNPLLSHTKEKYRHVFSAVKQAATYLESVAHCSIPEEEIGYLTLHFGAAIVRKQELSYSNYRVLLVCTGGMASSQLLMTRLEKELPYVHVADRISLLHVEEWLTQHSSTIDAIITTIPLQYPQYTVISVNPFLPADDIEKIKRELFLLKQAKRSLITSSVGIEDTVQRVNRYGSALLKLLERIYVFQNQAAYDKEHVIQQAVHVISTKTQDVEQSLLEEELRRREELGSLIFDDQKLVMLHCRSNGIQEMCVCVLRLIDDIVWSEQERVRHVILLVAPKDASREAIELISEISGALAVKEFMHTLTTGNEEDIVKHVQAVLRKGYTEKTNKALRGSL